MIFCGTFRKGTKNIFCKRDTKLHFDHEDMFYVIETLIKYFIEVVMVIMSVVNALIFMVQDIMTLVKCCSCRYDSCDSCHVFMVKFVKMCDRSCHHTLLHYLCYLALVNILQMKPLKSV